MGSGDEWSLSVEESGVFTGDTIVESPGVESVGMVGANIVYVHIRIDALVLLKGTYMWGAFLWLSGRIVPRGTTW